MMSKTIVMHTEVKAPHRLVRINNGESILTLRLHKKQMSQVASKLASILLLTALVFFLVLTYRTDNPLFWPLLKVSAIVGLVFFIAIKSNNSLIKSFKK